MNMVTLRRRLAKVRHFSSEQWSDLLRASLELARARRALHRTDPRSLVMNSEEPFSGELTTLLDRVAWAVPAAASVVPWRSDCLVQALAAQSWLKRAGMTTKLHLGVALDGGFLAHAWLTYGDRVITGGEVTQFVSFGPPV